jgi:hypothetical protein
MSVQVNLEIKDKVFRDAERLAQSTKRDINDLLATMLELSMAVANLPSGDVSALSDQNVLAISEMQMDSTQNARMSGLLDRQQAGQIDEAERYELSLLMYLYQEGSLRKAQALAEAVRRGLREPLTP